MIGPADLDVPAILRVFESHERYEVAVEVYRDIEKFAGSVESLMQAAPGSPNTGERAAMASYQDLFAMFAVLAIVCLIPVLLLRTRDEAARGLTGLRGFDSRDG